MKISIIGVGHVGLVTGACFAEMGNDVSCMDDDEKKINGLLQGKMPFYEPGLEEMVRKNVSEGRLSFTAEVTKSVPGSEAVFICVGTPQKDDGAADLTAVETVAKRVANVIDRHMVIVDKSTVPVKTGSWVKRTLQMNARHKNDFDVVSCPEFLREGSAVYDFMNPDRVVIGCDCERAIDIMMQLYKPLNAPIIVTNIETAELIKHASNAFLALKVSYINALANICEQVGADVTKVAEGLGMDARIGRAFLDAGIGYGGYCFPKDVAAFIKISEESGYDFGLLKEVQHINNYRCEHVIKKAKSLLWNLKGKTIGVLGLSFKPNTDDIREAPALNIIDLLLKEEASVKVYDPQAMDHVREKLPQLYYCHDAYEAAEKSDALIIATEWDEFKQLDLNKIRELLDQPIVIDGRNIYDPAEMAELGFIYQGVGR